MTKEALKLALEALEVANSCVDGYYIPKGKTHLPEIELAITAIKEALAQPEQEPVGWYDSISGGMDFTFYKPHRKPSSPSAEWIPVYSRPTPPQRTWVGLTDEDIGMCLDAGDGSMSKIISFIEAKLKDKNT